MFLSTSVPTEGPFQQETEGNFDRRLKTKFKQYGEVVDVNRAFASLGTGSCESFAAAPSAVCASVGRLAVPITLELFGQPVRFMACVLEWSD
jgi:hypothetical protein